MSQFQMPNIPQITDPQSALSMAKQFRDQAKTIRSSPDAGYETISYRVRRGGIAGFFGGTRRVSETRLKPGAKQLLDNASMLEQQATYFETLSKSLGELAKRNEALQADATAQEQAAMRIRKPVGEGGDQYTRNDLTKAADNSHLASMLGYGDQQQAQPAIFINPRNTLGGLRIPLGS